MRRIGTAALVLVAPAAAEAQRQVEGAGDAWPLAWILAIGAILTLVFVLYFLFAVGDGRPQSR
jgi:hypothetical protein